jgi:hypothetical protein
MNKHEMVNRLVAHCLQTLSADSTHEGVGELYRRGFSGFANMPERRLRQEMEFRGLIEADEPEQIDDGTDEDVSEDQLMFLVSGAAGSRIENHFFD